MSGLAQTIRRGIQQSVQRLFDGGADNLVQMGLNTTVVDPHDRLKSFLLQLFP